MCWLRGGCQPFAFVRWDFDKHCLVRMPPHCRHCYRRL